MISGNLEILKNMAYRNIEFASPITDDRSNLTLYIILMVAALIGVGATIIIMKKKRFDQGSEASLARGAKTKEKHVRNEDDFEEKDGDE
jgi:glucose-6-phosphate-specific signal transduction histidine kinase